LAAPLEQKATASWEDEIEKAVVAAFLGLCKTVTENPGALSIPEVRTAFEKLIRKQLGDGGYDLIGIYRCSGLGPRLFSVVTETRETLWLVHFAEKEKGKELWLVTPKITPIGPLRYAQDKGDVFKVEPPRADKDRMLKTEHVRDFAPGWMQPAKRSSNEPDKYTIIALGKLIVG
jgi:hypothetical protein